jgi:hypothetical protein
LKAISPPIGRKASADGGRWTKGPGLEVPDELVKLMADEEREQEKAGLHRVPERAEIGSW